MAKTSERIIYFHAGKCYEKLTEAIQVFEEFFVDTSPTRNSGYYRARNLLREAENFYSEMMKEARRFLGPVPQYASSDFEKWRTTAVEKNRVLAESVELNALRKELARDDYLEKWMSEEEREQYLSQHFEDQKKGKRKISNIKVRMLVDKLNELLARAQEMKKRAMEVLQSQT